MTPWILMKTISTGLTQDFLGQLQYHHPEMVVLECEIPEKKSDIFFSTPTVGALPLGVSWEVTCPRGEVKVVKALTIKQVLAMRPGHRFRTGMRDAADRLRREWPRRHQAHFVVAMSSFIATYQLREANPDWYKKASIWVYRFEGWRFDRWVRKNQRKLTHAQIKAWAEFKAEHKDVFS